MVMDTIASDTVTGLGMGQETLSGFNPGVHTSWYVAWKRGQSATSTPPVAKPVVPPFIHPVSIPQYRVITQNFGENPQVYGRFKVDGVALKGHNGLDFGTPQGVPILAVNKGTVVEVAEDPTGYGRYVKMQHSWGQSLYAHLSSQLVSVGQVVKSGWYLGNSGDTGFSTGPHLHFGLRVNPFNRADGWGGYVDPLPYLPVWRD
jgi:murein DD-endopeptidase MepM/ murein hydrolase activator NlpD